MLFDGIYELTLDAKNRLSIPARFRPTFADGVTAIQGLDGGVELWPAKDLEAVATAAMRKLNPMSRGAREMRRYFGGGHTSTLDSAGRMLLSPKLVSTAKLDKTVVVAGAMTNLVVWSPEAHAVNADATLDAVRVATESPDVFDDLPA